MVSQNSARGSFSRPYQELLHLESDFYGHLPMSHLVLGDIAAGFGNLKPAQVLDRFAGTRQGGVHGVLDGLAGGAGQFDLFIDFVFHKGWRVELYSYDFALRPMGRTKLKPRG